MKLFYLSILAIFYFLSANIFATHTALASFECTITTTLRVGSIGEQVRCLQSIVGAYTDGRFGPLTRASVVLWQTNHGLSPDGIVGPLTRAALFNNVSTNSPVISNQIVNLTPKVLGVYPEKVRSGDIVKIYGENFAPTGNTVRLRYGQIEDRFENLPSNDGKVISFVFQPPNVNVMNKEDLLNMPFDLFHKILDPVQAKGGSIDDIVAPYRNIQNEQELAQFLERNGHTFGELYDKFWVTVENANGRGSSHTAILSGLRKLSFGANALAKNNFFSIFNSLADIFATKNVYAQTAEGGYNSGIIMECTCGSGYLTYMTDFSDNGGSGLYYWSEGFVPTVGDPYISGPQLGFFTQNAGSCVITSGNSCTTITANVASLPWGEAP